jgi:hypothetical protein
MCWMSSVADPNLTAVIGVFKWAVSMNVRGKKVLPACMAVCRFTERCQLFVKFPGPCEIMKRWFDTALAVAFEQGGLQPDAFLRLEYKCLKLVLPHEELDAAVAAKGDYSSMLPSVRMLVSHGKVGEALFSHAVAKSISDVVQAALDAKLATVASMALTRDKIDLLCSQILTELEGLAGTHLLPAKRQVDVTYRATTFTRSINSLSQHVTLAVSCAWKSKAVLEGHLMETWMEQMLFGESGIVAKKPAGALQELVMHAAVARTELGRLFGECSVVNGPDLLADLKSSFPRFLATDAEFACEQMLIECICGDGSAPRLMRCAMQALPRFGVDPNPEQALQKLTALVGSKLHQLAPVAAQARVGLVVKYVSRIVTGQAIKLADAQGDKEMVEVISLVEAFCVVDRGTPGKPKKIYKAAAIKHIYADLAKKAESGPLDIAAIVPLVVWRHLLAKDDIAGADAIIKKANEGHLVLKKSGSSKKSASAAASSEDSAIAEAMSLFRN